MRGLACLVVLVTACATAPVAEISPVPQADTDRSSTTTSVSATTSTTAPSIEEAPTRAAAPPVPEEESSAEPTAVLLKANGEIPVYPIPEVDEPIRVLPPTTVLGSPTVVQVRYQRSDGWTRVALPGRPNGAEGWIRPEGLDRFEVHRRVTVDLSDRWLEVTDADGSVIFEAPVAIGAERSPTPTGSYFITDAVEILDGSGPWGPYAFGLSARSEFVTEFNGGDGIIGIHGTNRPNSIGSAASLGCVRLDNDTVAELWPLLTVGVPVEIRA